MVRVANQKFAMDQPKKERKSATMPDRWVAHYQLTHSPLTGDSTRSESGCNGGLLRQWSWPEVIWTSHAAEESKGGWIVQLTLEEDRESAGGQMASLGAWCEWTRRFHPSTWLEASEDLISIGILSWQQQQINNLPNLP